MHSPKRMQSLAKIPGIVSNDGLTIGASSVVIAGGLLGSVYFVINYAFNDKIVPALKALDEEMDALEVSLGAMSADIHSLVHRLDVLDLDKFKRDTIDEYRKQQK